MRQPEPQSAVTSFLSALADDLSAPPDEMTSWRQVTAAAAIVTSERSAGSSRAVRLAAPALISLIGLGSGGVALAGGLPAPIQDVAADVARAMPLPISIPYPMPVEETSQAPADAERRPMDGETHREAWPIAGTEAETRSAMSPSPSEPAGEPHLEPADGFNDSDDSEAWGAARARRGDSTGHHGELDEEARQDRWPDDQGWPDDEPRSGDERTVEERSGDDRSDGERSDQDRSDDDRSDGDRSEDDRSDDDGSDRD